MKRFGGDRVKVFLDRISDNDDDKVIESRMITRQVESAQKSVLKVTTTILVNKLCNTMML